MFVKNAFLLVLNVMVFCRIHAQNVIPPLIGFLSKENASVNKALEILIKYAFNVIIHATLVMGVIKIIALLAIFRKIE